MAITTKMSIVSDVNAQFVVPCSVLADWQQVAGSSGDTYLTTADGDPVTDPEAMTASSRRLLQRDNRMGTFLGVRMKYNTGLTNITSPILKIFGRMRTVTATSETVGPWQILKNRLGDLSVPLTVASTDVVVSASGPKATTPDPMGHYFDCQGCNEFLIAVETAMTATGTITLAALAVKII